MTTRALVGLDIGTSSAKGAAFDLEGHRLAAAGVAYRYETPRAGWAEIDAHIWWDAARHILRQMVATLERGVRIEAVGISGQAPTALLVDEAGQPLRPAILWLDVRAEPDTAPVAAATTGLEPRTGNRVHASALGPKLAWLRRAEPSRWARTRTVLPSQGYPVLRLTGRRVIDPSSAALCAPLYDAMAKRWSAEALARLDIPLEILPEIRPAHEIAGVVGGAAARETGLAEGTPVVVGGADFAASALAAGVTEPGEACLMLGTAGNLALPFSVPRFDTRLLNAHHVAVDRY
ncbi:MAG: hypothetical protein L0027_10895, partial [Candidatus Rokubacteria bacterium]|nr:hypothetical protein [Candidatus Rokubacteria bacterium]